MAQNPSTIQQDHEWVTSRAGPNYLIIKVFVGSSRGSVPHADTDGFVIPSIEIEDPNESSTHASQVEDSKHTAEAKKEENIYLGPHGAPPSQAKQDINSSGRKQKFKQKLKDADQRISGSGRENKLENLQDLVGGGKMHVNISKSSPRDWLDPHCHESQFEKQYPS